MSREKAASQIRFETGQIKTLLRSYATLLEACSVKTPDLVEMTAAASVLHSFYNGVENIFRCIAREIDMHSPSGEHWHRDLLVRMAADTLDRDAVISTELRDRLAEYLGFRHYYRHAYSFSLEWSELSKLVDPLLGVWDQLRSELERFLDAIEDQT